MKFGHWALFLFPDGDCEIVCSRCGHEAFESDGDSLFFGDDAVKEVKTKDGRIMVRLKCRCPQCGAFLKHRKILLPGNSFQG